jgi:hypothetical protein
MSLDSDARGFSIGCEAARRRASVQEIEGGEAARLAEKGAERERADTPVAPRIDAAFRDLTPATGKDWLAYYRGRAAAK